MLKKVTLLIVFISCLSSAQKPQTIAYVDMEYILQSIPEYEKAKQKLDSKAAGWRKKIQSSENEIEKLTIALNNEKILLTEDLIIERKEDIQIKEAELSKLRASYFGTKGAYFEMNKQLVQPIQDEVYNAIRQIVAKKKYDFVFERSSDLILLHANPKYNISKTVISYITKSEKEREKEEAKLKKEQSKAALDQRIEEQKKRKAEKESKVIHR